MNHILNSQKAYPIRCCGSSFIVFPSSQSSFVCPSMLFIWLSF